jgi:hypothetical protein
MYEVRSLWHPRTPLTAKQKGSKDFAYNPVIGPWTIKVGMVLTLSDAEFSQYDVVIEKYVACDCVKYRKKGLGEPVFPRLCIMPERVYPVLPADPTQPPP